MAEDNKEYIGDGVYVSFDGYQIWLETDRSWSRHPTHDRIALDPGTFDALCTYVEKLNEAARKANDNEQ